MKKNEFELLKRDLSARVPFGTKVAVKGLSGPMLLHGMVRESVFVSQAPSVCLPLGSSKPEPSEELKEYHIEEHEVRPYLYPMSVLTEVWAHDSCFRPESRFNARIDELISLLNECNLGRIIDKSNFNYQAFGVLWFTNMNRFECVPHQAMNCVINYLDSYHIDHRGMIDAGLAIDCTGMQIY